MGTLTRSTVFADQSVTSDFDFAVRVVMIDDRHDRRQLMSYVVEQAAPDVTVVGYADSPASAVQAVDLLAANTVLLDIQLPVAEGLDTISVLRDNYPSLRIVVCSFHKDPTTKRAALERGADAYLIKPVSPRDLLPLLRPAQLDKSWQNSS